jgi:hypothetical protein
VTHRQTGSKADVVTTPPVTEVEYGNRSRTRRRTRQRQRQRQRDQQKKSLRMKTFLGLLVLMGGAAIDIVHRCRFSEAGASLPEPVCLPSTHFAQSLPVCYGSDAGFWNQAPEALAFTESTTVEIEKGEMEEPVFDL